MQIVRAGDLHVVGLLAVRLRKAAVEALIHEQCEPESKIASAIMLFNQAHHEMPNIAIDDPYGQAELGAYVVLRRLCGETVAIYGNPEDRRAPAVVRWYDVDDKLLREWKYDSLSKARSAVRRWNLTESNEPTGYTHSDKGAARARS